MRVERKVSELRKDYIASYLRSIIADLQEALQNIETFSDYDNSYAKECLKRARRGFYQFRDKFVN